MAAYKFTKKRRDEFLELLASGGRRMASARAVGVDPRTVERAMVSDESFRELVHRAEMEANEFVVDALYQAAVSGNVTAVTLWLTNRDRDHWVKQPERIEVTGDGGGPLLTEVSGHVAMVAAAVLEDDESRDMARDLLRRSAGRRRHVADGEPGAPGDMEPAR